MQRHKIKPFLSIFLFLALTLPNVFADGGHPGGQQNAATQTAASSSSDAYTAEFLNQFPVIKVGFTPAPGNGHQASTILVMKNLRNLGFKGKFEIYYDASSSELGGKLEKFLPGFDHKNPSQQSIPSMDATIQPFNNDEYKKHITSNTNSGSLEAFGGRPMKGKTLAVCGGDDKNLNPDQMGTDYVIRFGASNFGIPEIRVATGPPEDRKYKRFELYEAHSMGLGNPAPKPKDPQDFIKKQFEGLSEEKSGKVNGLLAMEKVMNQHEVLTAYGLSYKNGWIKLATLLKATMKVQDNPELNLKKGVVVPLLSNFNEEEWKVFNSHLDETQRSHIKIVSATDPNIEATLKNIGPKDVVIVKVGAVPQGVWDHLIAESTYPPVIAGTTSHEYANSLGKPFINAVGSQNLSNRTLQEHFKTTGAALESGDVETIEKRLTDARTPGSAIQKEFQANVEDRQKNPERVQYIVSRLIDFDDQSRVAPEIREKLLNGKELTDAERAYLEQPAQANLRWTIALDLAKNPKATLHDKMLVIDEIYQKEDPYPGPKKYESLIRHVIENTPKVDGEDLEMLKLVTRVRFTNLAYILSPEATKRVLEDVNRADFNALSFNDWKKSDIASYFGPEKAKQFIEEAVRNGDFYSVAKTDFRYVGLDIKNEAFLSSVKKHPQKLGSLFYSNNAAYADLKEVLGNAPESERTKILTEYQEKAPNYDSKRSEIESFLKGPDKPSADPMIECIDGIAI